MTIKGKEGLHFRPAQLLVQLALTFESEIEVAYEEMRVDGKSIMHLLTLGAGPGANVRLIARGADAVEAIDALSRLVESDFDQQQVTSRDGAADGSS
ncbi:MAG: HPr family phosphocarrier protein [Pirellulales bacterium]|nr:HPr family phosphocarrier protein [Pirellulales bacterium]